MKTVAIIGGGFSGTMAAVNLVRLSKIPLHVQLINYKHPVGRGVAYGTNREEHLLNVPARNMSAVPDRPKHFLEWLRTRVEFNDLPERQLSESFVPRRVYGDYLRSLLLNYVQPIDDHHWTSVQIVDDEAVDIRTSEYGHLEVLLRDGEAIPADRVLLATGNQAPAFPAVSRSDFRHSAYCSDPWEDWSQRIPDPEADVIVLGAGLTMVDVFLTLSELGWPGKIVAISRNGVLPQAHFRGIEYPDFLPAEPAELGLQPLAELLEKHCRRLQRIGENPGIVVDRLRPFTQRIWQRLSLAEKQQFLARYAARWNAIRHRIAEPIHQRVTEAIAEGRLRIVRGKIVRLSNRDEGVSVTVQNSAGQEQTLNGGLVINCTGPNGGFSTSPIPLFQNLLRRGLIRPDELDMGIDVGADFAVIDADGRRSEALFAIGPLMKGTLWETTAVPELRGQAMRVAQLLLEDVAPDASEHDYRLSVDEEHVLEYYI